MQFSEKRLNSNLKKQIFQIFYQTIADLKNTDEAEIFFKDFLSKTARTALAKKLAIAVFLDKKRSYQNIKKTLGVSSSSVAEVYKRLSSPGFQLALKKVKTEEWADDWSKKIGGALKRILPQE
ncbi:hypothetical protein ISS86_00390 [Candidatus Microgenomates bacterium]|nr:hypothetical protein [Candidatus Microgenomates bacterium]